MKKVISCALAASIAGTSLGTVKIKRVQAVEDNSNLDSSSNKDNINIEIENMEPIVPENNDEKEDTTENGDSSEGTSDTVQGEGNSDSTQEESSSNKVESEGNKEEEKPSIDDNLGNKDEISDTDSDKENVEDTSQENNNEINKGEADNNDIIDSIPENSEDLSGDVPQDEIIDDSLIENEEEIIEEETGEDTPEEAKITGRLELDINFAMPVINSDNLDIQVELKNKDNTLGKIDLSKGVIDLKNDQLEEEQLENTTEKGSKGKRKSSKSNTFGKLDNGITYKIEKYDYQRKPLSTDAKDESIYYIKVTFEGLEKDTYSLGVSGSGYEDVSVEKIDIIDYSKRVKIGNTSSGTEYSSTFLAGDVDGNNEINMDDYEEVLDSIGKKKSEYDFNRDGKVDIAD